MRWHKFRCAPQLPVQSNNCGDPSGPGTIYSPLRMIEINPTPTFVAKDKTWHHLFSLKAEISVISEETLVHMQDIELAGPGVRLRTVWVTGLKRPPIKYRVDERAPALRGGA